MTVAEATRSSPLDPANLGARLESVGSLVCRYGLVVVIGWIGLMKFTAYEAQGIEPLVAHSPLLGWMYGFLSVQQFSTALGIVEVMIALLIAQAGTCFPGIPPPTAARIGR
jgi:reactive chlorine resistance protein C